MINFATLKLFAKSTMLWVVLGTLVATNSCSYLVGKAHKGKEVAEEQAVEARKETEAVKEEVKARSPVVSKKENVAAQQTARVASAKRDLYYAASNLPARPTCDLTDAEFDAYGVLADEINKATKRGSSSVQ